MIPYIAYAALITAVCFLFYRLLLHRETFFHLNRWFFVGCLVFSFLLPLVPVPGGWSLRRTAPAALVVAPAPGKVAAGSVSVGEASMHGVPAGSPVAGDGATGQVAAGGVSLGSVAAGAAAPVAGSRFSFGRLVKWVSYIYLCGALIFGFNLLLQLLVLLFRTRVNPVIRDGIYKIVETTGNRAPCSFGRYIFINPSLYDEETFTQILTHEKIHVQQGHSIDIMLAELSIALQWFNPFAWWYRKALEDNLEFLTDAAVIGDPRTNASHYQMSLLRVSAPYLPLSITSNYNQSLLKKRIIMMHIQKSSVRTAWKYLFLLPLFTAMVCIFNDTSAAVQNTTATKGDTTTPRLDTAAPKRVTAADTDATARDVDADRAEAQGAADAVVNAHPNVTVHVNPDVVVSAHPDVIVNGYPSVVVNAHADVVVKGYPRVDVNVHPDVDVDPDIEVNPNANPREVDTGREDIRSGSWMATIDGDEVRLTLKSENGESVSNSTFKKSEFSSLPTGSKGGFTLTRDAGTLYLNGVFDGNDGFGHYTFKENPEFVTFLEKEGVTGIKERQMLGAFFTNVRRDYVESLTKAGYTQLPFHELIALSAMKVDIAYIQSWKDLGYPDLPLHEVIALKSMNIDGAYLKDLKAAGFTNLAIHNVIAAKSMGIDAAYAQSWKQAGYTDLPMHELIAFKSQGIDGKYVHSFEQIGYAHLEPHDLVAFKSLGITPEFVKGFTDMGFKNIEPHTLEALKSMGVTSDYITAMKNKGFDSKDLQEYVKLKTFR